MIGPYASLLSHAERVQVLSRLLRAPADQPLAFTSASLIAGLAEAVPLLEVIAAAPPYDYEARAALTHLGPMRQALAPGNVLARVADWLAALCLEGTGARLGACQSLNNLLADARKHIDAGRTQSARDALEAFASRADTAHEHGALSDAEHLLLASNARHIVSRL
ncbi:MAG: FIMAH domain-containing protein [Gemmatimonadales bacterium]